MRVVFGNTAIIASYRKSTERADLEAGVLRVLHDGGAPVPRLLDKRGPWVLQEDVGARRLTAAVHAAAPEDRLDWLDRGLEGLAVCQAAALDAGLARKVPAIGGTARWMARLTGLPARVGDAVGIPAPALDQEALVRAVTPAAPRFIKWDARPGNAAVRTDGTVVWFDWEHCGVRGAVDDLAAYMADEYTPDLGPEEVAFLERWLPRFGAADVAAGYDYLCAFGTLQSLGRFFLAIARKGGGPWYDFDAALAGDHVGRTPEQGRMLCIRAARWAERPAVTRPLVPWLETLADAVPRL